MFSVGYRKIIEAQDRCLQYCFAPPALLPSISISLRSCLRRCASVYSSWWFLCFTPSPSFEPAQLLGNALRSVIPVCIHSCIHHRRAPGVCTVQLDMEHAQSLSRQLRSTVDKGRLYIVQDKPASYRVIGLHGNPGYRTNTSDFPDLVSL
jgi:hypothetical protein